MGIVFTCSSKKPTGLPAALRWDCWIASVRCATALPRSSKGRAWRVAPLCVEDPFETHLNTCRRIHTCIIMHHASMIIRVSFSWSGIVSLICLFFSGEACESKSSATDLGRISSSLEETVGMLRETCSSFRQDNDPCRVLKPKNR